ncbi:MAG: ATP-binding protein [Desulforhabdus sp.]|jgi:PAS domain S-box-containing protein|nr:ATP-binding protein [Desulforhabdus sp.]
MTDTGRQMNIAVIGGGRRCKAFLEMLDAKRFPRLHAQIVAVADKNENAVGFRMAREKGIFTTKDYHDFFKLKHLDLIIELTGNEALLEDFLRHNPAKVRVLEAAISRLFSDMIRFREEYLLGRRQLELIERIVESVFASMQDRVLIMQPDRKILDANEALLKSMGMSKEELVGKYCYQVSHQSMSPCDEKGYLCPLNESLQTGGVAHAIHEHFDRSNQTWYCEVTTVPLKNDQGEVELFLEIMRDITDELEKRVEQRTRILTRNLARLVHEDKMIALGKLVASAVHEINNPLTGINALARLMHQGLEHGPLSQEDLKQYIYYLHLIDTESARCSNIVKNLLSFSRQQQMENKHMDLNELVHKVALLFNHKMELQNIKFKAELDENLPQLLGDPGQIQQCLVNLYFNAMEAMPEGGTITVRTFFEASQNLIRLEVEDTGVGIPQEMLSQIFEPFFSTKNQDKGVGLGLSVVYGIIKEHHGSIYVKSEMGKGSNFIIRFFPTFSEEEGGLIQPSSEGIQPPVPAVNKG